MSFYRHTMSLQRPSMPWVSSVFALLRMFRAIGRWHTNCRMYPVFSSVCAAYFSRAQHVAFLPAHLTRVFWSVRSDLTGKFTLTTLKPSSVFDQMELGKRPLDRRRNQTQYATTCLQILLSANNVLSAAKFI